MIPSENVLFGIQIIETEMDWFFLSFTCFFPFFFFFFSLLFKWNRKQQQFRFHGCGIRPFQGKTTESNAICTVDKNLYALDMRNKTFWICISIRYLKICFKSNGYVLLYYIIKNLIEILKKFSRICEFIFIYIFVWQYYQGL